MQLPFDPFLILSIAADIETTGLRLYIHARVGTYSKLLTKASWFIFKRHQQFNSVLD